MGRWCFRNVWDFDAGFFEQIVVDLLLAGEMLDLPLEAPVLFSEDDQLASRVLLGGFSAGCVEADRAAMVGTSVTGP